MLAIFDSNVYDVFADNGVRRQTLSGAISAGRLRLLTTHIQRDELAAVTDARRREQLFEVLRLADPIATGGFVLGTSRLGEARLMSEADATVFDTKMRNGMSDARGTNDALIIATARVENATLVSEDRRCRARAQRAGVTAVSVAWLLQQLESN
ncbi:PIN domain-containing protein [Nocardioides sp. QY071]|uniref:PIN domain-containing protein n=1 Tax=Nocardioides sp. QY071 TaxID=3044187 RepID=UPI00249B2F3A|nr:PIN domain-containing protein [Nocardioides sp. QY071]WGY03336.1 PIN domain-containing protein [Nocardioides sp. QY071]